jgi:hypothetical protein
MRLHGNGFAASADRTRLAISLHFFRSTTAMSSWRCNTSVG